MREKQLRREQIKRAMAGVRLPKLDTTDHLVAQRMPLLGEYKHSVFYTSTLPMGFQALLSPDKLIAWFPWKQFSPGLFSGNYFQTVGLKLEPENGYYPESLRGAPLENFRLYQYILLYFPSEDTFPRHV